MKLPNGFGTVYRLSGNRRRPFVVKKTVDGKQKAVGYFSSHVEALSFLLKLNDGQSETFSQCYEKWSKRHFEGLSRSSVSAYISSYRHLSPLHDRPMESLRYDDLQDAIDGIEAGYATQKKARVLLSQLYKWAMKRDLVSVDYSRFVEIKPHVPVHVKRPFTVREINRLWKAADDPDVQAVLILIYTGLRVGELLALRPANIKIRERYLDIKHSKTQAGIRRVPIAKKILPFLEALKNTGGNSMPYDGFRRRFDAVMKIHGMHHTPHECRHTCASMLDSTGASDTACQMILGHARKGVTKAVYTHKTLSELRKAVDIL